MHALNSNSNVGCEVPQQGDQPAARLEVLVGSKIVMQRNIPTTWPLGFGTATSHPFRGRSKCVCKRAPRYSASDSISRLSDVSSVLEKRDPPSPMGHPWSCDTLEQTASTKRARPSTFALDDASSSPRQTLRGTGPSIARPRWPGTVSFFKYVQGCVLQVWVCQGLGSRWYQRK